MFYKLVLNKNQKSSGYNKWYGRASVVGRPVTTKQLAQKISARCTVTEPDILAVINALESEIADNVQAGKKVILNDFGSFKLGMSTKPADKASDFSVNNVKGLHVIFQPITNVDTATGKHFNAFTHGCRIESLANYSDPSKAEKSGEA